MTGREKRRALFVEFMAAQKEYDALTSWADGATSSSISDRLRAAAEATGDLRRGKA